MRTHPDILILALAVSVSKKLRAAGVGEALGYNVAQVIDSCLAKSQC